MTSEENYDASDYIASFRLSSQRDTSSLIKRLSKLSQAESKIVTYNSVGDDPCEVDYKREWLANFGQLSADASSESLKSRCGVLKQLADKLSSWSVQIQQCNTDGNIDRVKKEAATFAEHLSQQSVMQTVKSIAPQESTITGEVRKLEKSHCLQLLTSAAQYLGKLDEHSIASLTNAIFPEFEMPNNADYNALCESLNLKGLSASLGIGLVLRAVGLGWKPVNDVKFYVCGERGHRDGNDVILVAKTHGLELVPEKLIKTKKQAVSDWLNAMQNRNRT
jgi:hypothetical protein